jgi:Fe(II)/alpha-ketoglutarate-dependent arginine beta-hydroxylase
VEYSLRPDEVFELQATAKSLAEADEHPAQPGFYDRHWAAVEALPAGLRQFLTEFRRAEPGAYCLIHGFPTDPDTIGPTPLHWDAPDAAPRTVEQEICMALCGMVVGEPFAWATLQGGRMIQNILPIAGEEHRQSGYGSEALLEFHTEDGFHPDRCDYLMLFGLRNPERVPTIVAAVDDVALSAADRAVLAGNRYHILPDDEHIRQLTARDPQHPALDRILRMQRDPEAVAVFFGDPATPYLRIDRPFMRGVSGDPAAEAVLDRLMDELHRVQRDVVVEPGTMLIVDNYLAVHGRRSFRGRYDGTDRWLKKMTMRRDLRRGLMLTGQDHHRVRL